MMIRRWAAAALAAMIALAPPASACTGLRLVAADGAVVPGRTLEFGFDLQSNVVVIPKGTQITGSTPDGAKGLSYTTRYGMLGANAVGLPDIIDGINDQGLYVGLFYFPGYASYPEASPETIARGMAPFEYGNWLLGNFASVEEVKANFDKVALLPVVLDAIKQEPPVHFVVHDRNGNSVVIEPIDGKLVIHDNPLGVLTNSPTFDWHMTNLRNYINLSVTNVPPVELSDIKFAQFGEGTGLHGLPGDYTPPSRMVRAVVFSQSAPQSATGPDAVLQAFHLLNAFDIPVGSVREKNGNSVLPEYTLWTSVADLKNLKWYFRTFADQSIRSVDLATAIAAAGGKIKTITMESKQPVEDVSKDLQ
ncbi:Choloylglycine hydrolase [Methylocella tundrae]|uniref:Choloylglycine hydrolase n=1 Tax=Methylocella tundrae TaxID=227605 RepID=A0A4U8Z3L5_METTU|nr:choloylglycine hydrolase family protein [Methylocella tundrae]VFU10047.1 Choloylglycine hydrolase [Methylocella tundrae]